MLNLCILKYGSSRMRSKRTAIKTDEYNRIRLKAVFTGAKLCECVNPSTRILASPLLKLLKFIETKNIRAAAANLMHQWRGGSSGFGLMQDSPAGAITTLPFTSWKSFSFSSTDIEQREFLHPNKKSTLKSAASSASFGAIEALTLPSAPNRRGFGFCQCLLWAILAASASIAVWRAAAAAPTPASLLLAPLPRRAHRYA